MLTVGNIDLLLFQKAIYRKIDTLGVSIVPTDTNGRYTPTVGEHMEITYGNKLQAMELPEPPSIIDGILPEGYTVMFAPRKSVAG